MGELDKIDDGLKKIEEGAKKTFNVFENNKNVIIVGNGPSGCDLGCLAIENNANNVKIFYVYNIL